MKLNIVVFSPGGLDPSIPLLPEVNKKPTSGIFILTLKITVGLLTFQIA